jgi:hypothetical protein
MTVSSRTLRLSALASPVAPGAPEWCRDGSGPRVDATLTGAKHDIWLERVTYDTPY